MPASNTPSVPKRPLGFVASLLSGKQTVAKAFATATTVASDRLSQARAFTNELVPFVTEIAEASGAKVTAEFHSPLAEIDNPLDPSASNLRSSLRHVIATFTFSHPEASRPVSLFIHFDAHAGTVNDRFELLATVRYTKTIATGGKGSTGSVNHDSLASVLREVGLLLWGFNVM